MGRIGWTRGGAEALPHVPSPYIRLPLWTLLTTLWDGLGFLLRYLPYWWRRRKEPESLFIDTFRPIQPKPFYGVPVGTLGSGSLGRDYRGAFCKFSLRPGLVETDVESVPADHFILRAQRVSSQEVYQKVLSATGPVDGSPSSWAFDFPASDVAYRGLFPRSWTTFEARPASLTLEAVQMSPVIRGDYEDSSLPVASFRWDVRNAADAAVDVALTFAFRSGTGDPRWATEAAAIEPLHGAKAGLKIIHSVDGIPLTYGLAAEALDGQSVSLQSFNPDGPGEELWGQLRQIGCLNGTLRVGDKGIAVCVSARLPPKSCTQMSFALVWHMPLIHFGGGLRTYKRRYTRWYGTGPEAVEKLCEKTLDACDSWHQRIEEWQAPIIGRTDVPELYRSAVLNELYFLVDGGSVWVEWEESQRAEEPHISDYTADRLRRYGRFLYLESYEYRMFNTYDVHFYASWALASLWPELEHCIQAEYGDLLGMELPEKARFMYNGDVGPVKAAGAIPHDLGSPADEPWVAPNAYRMHDTGSWRDLNLKWVLLTARASLAPGSDRGEFLGLSWPRVDRTLRRALALWDADGDGVIENSGRCDQTFDNWHMSGTSAYCGSLWLASLYSAVLMAQKLGKRDAADYYTELLKRAVVAFEDKLWTGSYYKFDESLRSGDTIMADQLCGIVFLRTFLRPLPEILPPGRVRSALRRVFESNVAGFEGGGLGAVNGMLHGVPEGTNPQGSENPALGEITVFSLYPKQDDQDYVWPGITYALAAGFLAEGMRAEAWTTLCGLHDQIWNRRGMQFQTPEAVYANGCYRAIGYMRPLSIWAVQWVLDSNPELMSPDQMK